MAIHFGCCIPGASFMPEAPDKEPYSPYEVLLWGSKEIISKGFDFAECSVGLLMSISDEDFEKLIKENVKIRSFNCFVPSELKIIENSEKMWDYIEKAFYRMEKLSAQIIVFGSGGARRIPDTMEYEDGLKILENFIIRCNELAKRHNMLFVLEPLNRNESNFMPTVKSAHDLCKKLNLSNTKILADIFHMHIEKESFSVINEAIDEIYHVHINNPLTRSCPTLEENEIIRNFADSLCNASYDKTVAIESSYSDFSNEIGNALKYLKEVFKQ